MSIEAPRINVAKKETAMLQTSRINRAQLIGALAAEPGTQLPEGARQLSFFDTTEEDLTKCLTGQI